MSRPVVSSEQARRLHARDAAVFENWTHDAALIPMAFFPYWQRVFQRRAEHLHGRFHRYHGAAFQQRIQHVLAQIAAHGPQMARDFDDKPDPNSEKWGWNWHPSKAALEYLWRTGGLVVAKREGFQKVYDLPERVIPDYARVQAVSDECLVDWACASALERLGFASPAELAAFWDVISLSEAKAWCERQRAESVIEVSVEAAEANAKSRLAFMRPETLETLTESPSLPVRPGDPRPQAGQAPVRFRLPHRNLRAGSQTSVWLLRLPPAGRRAADRADRHEMRPRCGCPRRAGAMAGAAAETNACPREEAGAVTATGRRFHWRKSDRLCRRL